MVCTSAASALVVASVAIAGGLREALRGSLARYRPLVVAWGGPGAVRHPGGRLRPVAEGCSASCR